MSETKSGGKTVGDSENFRYHSEIFAIIAKFRYVYEIFAMCAKFSSSEIANFFFFEK